MFKVSRNLLITALLLASSVAFSSCGSGNYYDEKLVNDARESFDISKSKAECFVRTVINRTGWEAKKVWNVLDDFDSPYSSDEDKLWDATESAFRSCGVDPN